MSNDDATKAAEAAIAVMNALQPLSNEERARVLNSAAALFGVAPPIPSEGVRQPVSHREPEDFGGEAPAPRRSTGKRMSIGELLDEKAASTNQQRIACFAYYREKHEGDQNFSASDLLPYFAKAKAPAPGRNYMRDYNKAVKLAWIHDDGSKSYLTGKGEAAVEAGFGGKRKSPSTAGKKRKAAKAE
jgi:hypothetical protein